MTLLQKFLREGGTIEVLSEKYAIKAVPHKKYPNLILFKYNQIESPFAEPIVRECRGIILDKDDDWKIISRPFDKFFNYGEGHAAPIDWSTAKVQEKVDGSLATIYMYDGDWHIATSGTPDASGLVNDFGFSFADLFWKTYNAAWTSFKPEFRKEAESMCFMFELCTPYNKVVVRHETSKLVLLGGRNLITQQEMTAAEAGNLFTNMQIVKEFPLQSFEEIAATFPSIDPLSQEGYVVVDAQFNRVKVKSPAYVALHHMRDGLSSQKSIVQVALNGEIDEVGVAFPEFLESLVSAKAKIYDLVVELETAYEKIKDIPIQKDFALEAVKTRCSSALFAMRRGKTTSMHTFLRDMQIDSVMTLLGYKKKADDTYIDTDTYSTK